MFSKKKGGSKTAKKNTNYVCKDCDRTFTRADSLKKHINLGRCKKQKTKVTGNKNMVLEKNKIGNKCVIGNKNTVNNGVVINLVVFAKDGIGDMTYEELLVLLGSKNNLIEELTKVVNLNPEKPQHHNILYSDMKSTYGEVYENNKWVKKKINEILEKLIDAKMDDLNDILTEMGEYLNEKTINRIKYTIESTDYSKPDARKKLKTYLKPILYNNKDIILKTKKLTKK